MQIHRIRLDIDGGASWGIIPCMETSYKGNDGVRMTFAHSEREIVLCFSLIQRYVIQTKFSDKRGGKQCAGECGRSIVPLVGFVGVTMSVTDWEHCSTYPRAFNTRLRRLDLNVNSAFKSHAESKTQRTGDSK